MTAMVDRTGQRFGRLLVIEKAESRREKSGRPRICWRCLCECGSVTVVPGNALVTGNTKSCGCQWRIQRGGCWRTPEYMVWKGMKARCNDPRCNSYERYGGKGITYVPEWESFHRFLRDMGPRPSLKYTLDRIDNSKGYGPDNCRWATREEQEANKSTAIWITHNGERLPLTEVARRTGVDRGLIYSRYKAGWPDERLTVPPMRRRSRQE